MRMKAQVFLQVVGLAALVLDMVVGRYNCHDKSIESREEEANIVVSGMVDRIMREPKQMTYSCEIKVIRFFKGEDILSNAITADNKIMVKGFGNPSVCDNTAHKGDVRIIMMNQDTQGHISLNSSLVRITLVNLEHAEAAVSDIPYSTLKPVTQGPCRRVLCGFGGLCQVNEKNKAVCICPDTCSSIFSPVCGSDGLTYFSDCVLQQTGCVQRQIITKKYEGVCQEFGNPCGDINCQFGAECMISPDGITAKCVCPQDCDLSDYSMVCGSDGATYLNECELRRQSCMQRKNIAPYYLGECNPCKDFDCPTGVCALDEGRTAFCRCDIECDEVQSSPVCGNDWITYNSSCEMERAACSSGLDLFVYSTGQCIDEINPCLNWVCPFSQCVVKSNGEPKCVCSVCMDIYEPVCGTDGNTYDSECHFKKARCDNDIEMIISNKGECVSDAITMCKEHECSFGGFCAIEGGKPLCKCDMMCPDVYEPVCGTDGLSYSSECSLRQAACQLKVNVSVAYEELCEGCEDFNCPFGGICEMTINGPVCVCPEGCVAVYAPVCGSDEVTYDNECLLRVQSCKSLANIRVVSQGLCGSDACANVNCDFGAFCDQGQCKCITACPRNYDPVCGDDGRTYTNECFLKVSVCETRKNIQKEFDGMCDGKYSRLFQILLTISHDAHGNRIFATLIRHSKNLFCV